ncbi:hypothetical protein ACQ859_02270 [Roseateles chitinivorans]|uniref:hypothetical protein n=1 Tax=Roseateles chitinivorans TaxID=2917965 RepID=UPI003D6729CF
MNQANFMDAAVENDFSFIEMTEQEIGQVAGAGICTDVVTGFYGGLGGVLFAPGGPAGVIVGATLGGAIGGRVGAALCD